MADLEEEFTRLLVLQVCGGKSTCVTILLQVCSNVLLSVIPW